MFFRLHAVLQIPTGTLCSTLMYSEGRTNTHSHGPLRGHRTAISQRITAPHVVCLTLVKLSYSDNLHFKNDIDAPTIDGFIG